MSRERQTKSSVGARGLAAAGRPLRLLTRFSSSELASRLGLKEPVERIVGRGIKDGLQAGARAASVFRGLTKPLTKPARLASPPPPDRFDLTPSDEQKLVIDTMRRFADEVIRPAAEAADDAASPPSELIAHAHELGLAMLAIPEALGGAADARSPVTSALIAEELARGDAGLAVACLAPLAVVNALVDAGTAGQQSRYLPAFAADEPIGAALALFEPQPLFDPRRPTAGAVAADGGWRLHGTKSMVPLGASAELFVVAAQVLGLGPRLFLVEAGAPGLTVAPEPAMGLRAAGLCRLVLDGVEVGADAMLGGPGRDAFDLGEIVDRSRIAWGAIAVGASQAMLDYVIAYCNDRIAFGEPITHRQSVAFLIADMAIELEGMRLMVRRAAARAEQGLSITREATLVKTHCSGKAMAIGSNGIQLLGGAGFIKDHPVERWYRHLRGTGIIEGALLV
jgi:hypothetical protein